jgi:uncharacterized protein (DUF305 family)
MNASRRRTFITLLLPVALVAMACGGGGDANETDTASAAAASAGSGDTAMSSMTAYEHATMTRPAARDSNQAFLRMMVDHHEGLVTLVDSATPKLAGAARADAEKVGTKQETEQQRMQRMLSSQHGDSITPAIMTSNDAMIRAVASAPADAAGRAFYEQTVAHHREGIEMSRRLLPHLTGEVKQMAEKMIADQEKEVAEFEKKAGGAS